MKDEKKIVLELYNPSPSDLSIEIFTLKATDVIVSTIGNLTYTELCNEINVQPYLLTKASIFANTISQVSKKLKKTRKETNGIVREDFNYIAVDPMQKQYAINNIELNFTPSPLNGIEYTVEAGERVRIWFYYENKDLINIDSKKADEVELINNKKEDKKMKNKVAISNPMFVLINRYSKRKTALKDVIKSKAKFRKNDEISEQEVFESFDGSDFKEIQ